MGRGPLRPTCPAVRELISLYAGRDCDCCDESSRWDEITGEKVDRLDCPDPIYIVYIPLFSCGGGISYNFSMRILRAAAYNIYFCGQQRSSSIVRVKWYDIQSKRRKKVRLKSTIRTEEKRGFGHGRGIVCMMMMGASCGTTTCPPSLTPAHCAHAAHCCAHTQRFHPSLSASFLFLYIYMLYLFISQTLSVCFFLSIMATACIFYREKLSALFSIGFILIEIHSARRPNSSSS